MNTDEQMEIKANKYAGKDILRFIRENTNLTQKSLLKTLINPEIGKHQMKLADSIIPLMI